MKYIRTPLITKLLMSIVGVFFMVNQGRSQDIHFSQFYHSPLLLNPAQTGLICSGRVGINYRNQWRSINVASPYRTFAGFGDMRWQLAKKFGIGLGIDLFQDVQGDGQLTTLEINPSVAFHFGGDKFKFSLGFQPAMRQRKFDQTRVLFEEQYDPTTGQLNPLLSNNETNLVGTFSSFDLNTGLQVSVAPSEKASFWVGLADYHVLQPAETFLKDASNKLNSRYVFNTGGKFTTSEKMYVAPGINFMMQSAATELNLGTEIGYRMGQAPGDLTLLFGPFIRSGTKPATRDIVLLVGGEIKGVRLGFTYDFNISALQKAPKIQGGYELALIYRGPCPVPQPKLIQSLVAPWF